jgi:fructose-1,6-bisphosphatase/inositol monophosphatase family enzyme
MKEDLYRIKKLADEARKVIIETLKDFGERASETVKIGAYGAPSSLVDVRAENSIIDMVKEEDMPYNIFTEEVGYIDRGYEKTIIVDPLDGSYNAENCIPFYAVSIAVGKKNLQDVEVGFVKNVPLNDEYWAILGEGAYKNGKRLKVNGKKNLYVIYLGKKAHPKSFELVKDIRRTRALGSASLEMCMVAEGIADMFIYNFKENGYLRIVDIAASHLIVKEAGGIVVDENLKPLEMSILGMERKSVIAAANHQLLEVFK